MSNKLKLLVCVVLCILVIIILGVYFSMSYRSNIREVKEFVDTEAVEEGTHEEDSEELLYAKYGSLISAAEELLYISIQQSNGFEDFNESYGYCMSKEALDKSRSKFELFYQSNTYTLTGDDALVVNEEGLYPYYDDDWNISGYVSESEYVKRMSELNITHIDITLGTVEKTDKGLLCKYSIGDNIQSTIEVDVDFSSEVITDFCEYGVD